MFFLELLIGILILVSGVLLLSVIIGVPFLPTHRRQAVTMMDLAEVGPEMTVVDLGSGAGRLLFLAASRGAHAIGYELNPFLCWWTRAAARAKGLSGSVEVRCASLYQADLNNVDRVFAFLFNKPMEKLEHKLFSELKPGAKIVSYTFPIPQRVPLVKKEGIFVYEV